jgi:hypothetical protein
LNIFAAPVIFPSCQFTNFIVTNANATAKSSSAQQIGKTPNVRTAARKNCPRNFPRSLRPVLVPQARDRPAKAAAAAIVAAAVATSIEILS